MAKLHIERLGGLGGFGGQNSHLRSHGEIEVEELSALDKKTVDNLFSSKAGATHKPDGFRYRITRNGAAGTETIETSEEKLPDALKQCVRDEFV